MISSSFRMQWRAMWMVAEMSFRQLVMDAFVIFTVLVQPLLIALLALWMLTGQDYAMFVVVGSGMTGLWSSLLFMGGNSINIERWSGTLETLVGVPTSLSVIVFGKNLANVLQSLASMIVAYLLAALIFGYDLQIQQPLMFGVSLALTVIAFMSFGLIIAPIFVMNPSVQAWQAEAVPFAALRSPEGPSSLTGNPVFNAKRSSSSTPRPRAGRRLQSPASRT